MLILKLSDRGVLTEDWHFSVGLFQNRMLVLSTEVCHFSRYLLFFWDGVVAFVRLYSTFEYCRYALHAILLPQLELVAWSLGMFLLQLFRRIALSASRLLKLQLSSSLMSFRSTVCNRSAHLGLNFPTCRPVTTETLGI